MVVVVVSAGRHQFQKVAVPQFYNLKIKTSKHQKVTRQLKAKEDKRQRLKLKIIKL